MKRFRVLLASMLLLPLSAFATADALRTFDSLALAPNGERTIDVEALDPGNLPERPHGSVVLRDAHGKTLGQFDPCPTCRYSDTAWSPRGDAFAFVGSDTKSGKTFIYRVAHGAVETLSEIEGAANTLRFAPDGSRLALLVTLGAHKKIGAVEAGAPQVGEIGESADEQRIATLALVPGSAPVPVSPDDLYVYEYDWTPDGKGFAATAAEGNGDDNWWVARLVHVDAADGALRTIAKPAMQMNLPRVSPDGRSVAFIGGLMSDWGAVGGDVYTVPIGGGEPVDVTPDFKGSFNTLAWDGAKLLGVALADDRHAIVEIDAAKRSTRTRWSTLASTAAQRLEGSIAFSANRRAAATVIEDFTHAPEIALGTPDALAVVTHNNAGFGADVSVQSLHWDSEGFRVQGWLVGPPHVAGSTRHPLVVIVHGGPSSATQPRYISANGQSGLMHDLIERGYYLLYPNPRGSYGQGETFTRANRRDFGGGDLRDILAGIDAAAKAAPIDPDRVGAFGHSYGGWMTMWMNTQTHRFKALVSGVGVANWLSYYGQNGIDQWMLPFFGASVYDDPAVYRKSSPIEFIKQAQTPTLIYVGERDVECPAPQSQEYWHALRTLGVPTQFVIYPGEGHAFRDPKHTQDLRKRVVAWYDRWLK